MNNEWSKEWPTGPGWYWLFGITHDFGGRVLRDEILNPDRLHMVKVERASNGLVAICNGRFLYKSEGAKGLWMKLLPPELPQKEEK